MPARPWYPRNPGDYRRDTAHLTLEQHGAYNLLLDFAWDHDGLIPKDFPSMARILGVHTNKAKTLWGFLSPFWYETRGGFRQKRVDKELEKAIDISKERADAGRLGGLAKAKQLHKQMPSKSQPHKDTLNTSPSLFPENSSSQSKGEVFSSSEPAQAPAADDAKVPPCPHQKLVDLWHEKVPSLARVRKVEAEGLATKVRARWREVILGKDRENGQTGRRDPDLALRFFENQFERVEGSDWLCGRTPKSDWTASYPWVMQRSKFYKLLGGDYD